MKDMDIHQFLFNKLEELAKRKGKNLPENSEIEFFEMGLVDSVEFLKLITDVEKHFQIRVDFAEASPDSFQRLRALADHCAKFL